MILATGETLPKTGIVNGIQNFVGIIIKIIIIAFSSIINIYELQFSCIS
jgi:hypothetical protein